MCCENSLNKTKTWKQNSKVPVIQDTETEITHVGINSYWVIKDMKSGAAQRRQVCCRLEDIQEPFGRHGSVKCSLKTPSGAGVSVRWIDESQSSRTCRCLSTARGHLGNSKGSTNRSSEKARADACKKKKIEKKKYVKYITPIAFNQQNQI